MSADGFPVSFGRYQLVERLAVGGMAELFKARVVGAHGFQKAVVIKKILPHLAVDASFVAMFIDEAKITARLDHPKIAQVLELGTIDDALYIAMEFVDGLDVLAILRACAQKKQSLPPPLAVHICAEVLDALDYAHQARDDDGEPLGIVHRDISPSNILISRRGDVKLADFGIAHALDRQQKTQAGMLKGKYGYMSPEQVIGGDLDGRSDLFAVGTVMAEMLMGRRLFTAPNELDVLLMVRDVRLDRLDKYGANIEPDLRELLAKALTRDPKARYPTAGAFRDTLIEYLFQKKLRVGVTDLAALVESLSSSSRPAVHGPGTGSGPKGKPGTLVGPNTKASEVAAAEAAQKARDKAAQLALAAAQQQREQQQREQQQRERPQREPPSAPAPAPAPAPAVAPVPAPAPAAPSPRATLVPGHPHVQPRPPAAPPARAAAAAAPRLDAPPDAVDTPRSRAATASLGAKAPLSSATPERRPVVPARQTLPMAPIGGDDEDLETRPDASSYLREHHRQPPVATAMEVDISGPIITIEQPKPEPRLDLPPAPAARAAPANEADFSDLMLEVDLGDVLSRPPPNQAAVSPVMPAPVNASPPVPDQFQTSPTPVQQTPAHPTPARIGRFPEAPDEQGELSQNPPIRILYRLAVERASGLLVVDVGGPVGGVTKEIYFANGAPEFVASNIARELLGEYLVAQKVISQGELAMALAMMPHFGGKLGDTLVGLGLMKPLDVFRHLTRQVREKIVDVCTWQKGYYHWYHGKRNLRESFPLGLDAFEVLGAGATAVPLEMVEGWASPLLDHAPVSAKNARVVPEAFRLGNYPRDVYNRLDGRATLRQLASRFTSVDDRTAFLRTLYLLVHTDLAYWAS